MDDSIVVRQDATGPDMSRPVATAQATDYILTIEQVADLYAKAGHPRTVRSLQRYCVKGHLDSQKKETALGGEFYLVTPQSVSRHIAQIEELRSSDMVATGRDQSRLVATPVAGQQSHSADPQVDDTPRQATAGATDLSRYVDRIEREVEQAKDERDFLREQIDRKDRTIEALIERDRETNILVGSLHKLLSPLLGTPRNESRGGEGNSPL